MLVNFFWLVLICTTLTLYVISFVHFIRRVSRSFRRVSRRVTRRVGRGPIRRVTRKVSRVHRRIAKTDPQIFQSISTASARYMEEALNKKDKKRIKEKDIKKEVKTKVAIEIESQVQESPMREMRPLVDKTIEATIDLEFLKEISNRGDQAGIVMVSPVSKIIWRLIVPLATAGVAGSLTYVYPDKIPPGSLIIPERQRPPTGGPLLPIDPLEVVQSTAINAVVFGIGALVLVGLVILLRRR